MSVEGSGPPWESRRMLGEKFRRRRRVLPNKINFSITKWLVFSLVRWLEIGGGGSSARWCEVFVVALKSVPKVANVFKQSFSGISRVSNKEDGWLDRKLLRHNSIGISDSISEEVDAFNFFPASDFLVHSQLLFNAAVVHVNITLHMYQRIWFCKDSYCI